MRSRAATGQKFSIESSSRLSCKLMWVLVESICGCWLEVWWGWGLFDFSPLCVFRCRRMWKLWCGWGSWLARAENLVKSWCEYWFESICGSWVAVWCGWGLFDLSPLCVFKCRTESIMWERWCVRSWHGSISCQLISRLTISSPPVAMLWITLIKIHPSSSTLPPARPSSAIEWNCEWIPALLFAISREEN